MSTGKVIAIYSSKGGQGKSTLTIVLATWAGLTGLQVGVVDGDDGKTVLDWVAARKQAGKPVAFESVPLPQFDFIQRTIQGISYDVVFIDFPAAFNSKIELALSHCDSLILPIKIGGAELARLQRLFENKVIREIPKIFVLNQLLWFEREWFSPTRRSINSLIKPFNSPIIEVKYRLNYGKLMAGESFWDGRKPKLYSGELWDELRDLFQAVGLPTV